MKTLKKIEKKGFKVTNNLGYRFGVQVIASVTAEKDGRKYTERSLTKLYETIKNH